ncbi:organic cation transporter 1-like [Homarus americanus]|uniref:Organic cation transporter 1-like 3 n=1 Tax=Homarus americanus TaxID=6706 RepID=A0A8J5JZS0_HOMAM|nr:organic cation transporter 1-like [Homarus americanus]XP_042229242.1 organic cation transporter 1-like [Homarus americanus]KAG7164823.1 Organic cation transporter 1-like 3 [Homarus americanus]
MEDNDTKSNESKMMVGEDPGSGGDEGLDPSLTFFERVMVAVGTEGRYQKLLLYAFMLPLSFYSPFGASSLLLMMSTPDHSCHVPGRAKHNVSVEEWQNMTLPWEAGADGTRQLSKCSMYNISYGVGRGGHNTFVIDNTTTTYCQYGWDYDRRNWQETSVTHFDWVCDQASTVTTIFSLAVAGNAVGTLLLSILADRVGRRPVFFLAASINFFFGVVNMYMPNWQFFAIARFLNCFAFFSIYQMPYIIVVELSSEKLRGLTAALSFVVGTLGMCCVSLCAWLLANWRSFGLLCHIPSILFLLYWKFLPESPRWLLSVNRVKECEAIMTQVAITNGRRVPPDLRRLLEEARAAEKKSASVRDLLKHKTLRKHLLIATLNTVIFCVVYSGIVLNIHNMTGNEFVNFFVLSLVEIPGNILGMVSAQYLGRRLTTIYTLSLSAIFSGLASTAITDQWLLVTFCGLVKLFVTEAVLVVYVQIGELFPTPLRSISYGVTAVTGLSATVLVPTLMALGNTDRKLPYYILCSLCLCGAMVSTFLPETLGLPLPQTVQQASKVGRDQPYCAIVTHWTKHNRTPSTYSHTEAEKGKATVNGITSAF